MAWLKQVLVRPTQAQYQRQRCKTMKAIESAKVHFSGLAVEMTEVPEWGTDGEPLQVYYKPMTLAEKNKLYKLAQNDDLEIMAYTLIYKALDSDGNKIFDLGDKRALMHEVDADVAAELAGKIMSGASIEEQKGK